MNKIDDVVKAYLEARRRKAVLKKEYEEKTAKIDELLSRCEAMFAATMKQLGVTSLPTDAGTPYFSNRVSITVADPAAYRQWVEADLENRWAFLDLKANKTAVEAFVSEYKDLPPGLNRREELTVNVRGS